MSKKNANSATMAKSNNADDGGTPPPLQRKQSGLSYASAVRKSGKEANEKGSSKGNDIKMSTPGSKTTETMTDKAVEHSNTDKGRRYNIKSTKSRKLRIENHTKLAKIVDDIMRVYIAHDNGHNKSSCDLWDSWCDKGILDKETDIHKMASVIDFPENRFISGKAIGQFLWNKSQF